MRLLLDESVPARLYRALPDHLVSNAVREGWSGVTNGKLLALAATAFDAFITVDKNLPYQQNLESLPIALIVLGSYSNELHAEKRQKSLVKQPSKKINDGENMGLAKLLNKVFRSFHRN